MAQARFTASVLLPTPPLPLATATIFFTPANGAPAPGVAAADCRGPGGAFGAATAQQPLLRYAGALLFSTLGGLVPGCLFALAPRVAPSERTVATTVGWLMQWSAFGQVSGPPLAAWVASQAGGWHFTWAVTGAGCALGAALAALVGRHLRR